MRYLIIFLLMGMMLLSACSGGNDIAEQQEMDTLSSVSPDSASMASDEEMAENDAVAGVADKDVAEGVDWSDSAEASTMTKCSGGTNPKYLIYLSDELIYQKVSVSEGGFTETLISPAQSCAKITPSDTPAQCFDSSPSKFREDYEAIAQLTEEPMRSALGLSCSDVDFDETVFSLE